MYTQQEIVALCKKHLQEEIFIEWITTIILIAVSIIVVQALAALTKKTKIC